MKKEQQVASATLQWKSPPPTPPTKKLPLTPLNSQMQKLLKKKEIAIL